MTFSSHVKIFLIRKQASPLINNQNNVNTNIWTCSLTTNLFLTLCFLFLGLVYNFLVVSSHRITDRYPFIHLLKNVLWKKKLHVSNLSYKIIVLALTSPLSWLSSFLFLHAPLYSLRSLLWLSVVKLDTNSHRLLEKRKFAYYFKIQTQFITTDQSHTFSNQLGNHPLHPTTSLASSRTQLCFWWVIWSPISLQTPNFSLAAQIGTQFP